MPCTHRLAPSPPQELASYSIISAPVIDADTSEYIGLLDVGDVLRALCHRAYPELLDASYVATHRKLSMAELQNVGFDVCASTAGEVMHRTGGAWFRGDTASTLLEVVRSGFQVQLRPHLQQDHSPGSSPRQRPLQSSYSQRVHHRIAVFNILPGEQTPDGPIPAWRVADVVSQTDVLRLLASRVEALAATDAGYARSLRELGLVQGAQGVATVPASMPALAAFALMHRQHLSGVGVTAAEGGGLLANLSVSDLRGLTPERFGALALPVGAFLLFIYRGGGAGGSGLDFSWDDVLLDRLPPAVKAGRWTEALAGLPLVRCSPEATLREALLLLVHAGKHRVYVCEEGSATAVGVVTPTDILRAVTAVE